MFVRVMHIQSTPDKIDQVTALYRAHVEPSLRMQPGFNSTLLLSDPTTGKGLSITLWNTQAAQEASERDGLFLAQVGKVAPFLSGPPVRENFVAEFFSGLGK